MRIAEALEAERCKAILQLIDKLNEHVALLKSIHESQEERAAAIANAAAVAASEAAVRTATALFARLAAEVPASADDSVPAEHSPQWDIPEWHSYPGFRKWILDRYKPGLRKTVLAQLNGTSSKTISRAMKYYGLNPRLWPPTNWPERQPKVVPKRRPGGQAGASAQAPAPTSRQNALGETQLFNVQAADLYKQLGAGLEIHVQPGEDGYWRLSGCDPDFPGFPGISADQIVGMTVPEITGHEPITFNVARAYEVLAGTRAEFTVRGWLVHRPSGERRWYLQHNSRLDAHTLRCVIWPMPPEERTAQRQRHDRSVKIGDLRHMGGMAAAVITSWAILDGMSDGPIDQLVHICLTHFLRSGGGFHFL
jgi:hypothetical protein